MERHTKMFTGIAVIVIAVLVSSPVLAHQKYRRNPAGHYPLRIRILHSHDTGEPAAIVTPTRYPKARALTHCGSRMTS